MSAGGFVLLRVDKSESAVSRKATYAQDVVRRAQQGVQIAGQLEPAWPQALATWYRETQEGC